MLIKWIICTVAPEKKGLFSAAQARWADVKHVPGFLGQLGGWDLREESQACVLAFWEDEAAYQNFMQQHHDPIYVKTEQRGTYDGIRVAPCRSLSAIPGELDSILQGLGDAAVLRVADQKLLPGQREAFLQKQAGVWNPGMKQAGGMLAGLVSEVPADPNRLLVTTLWRSEAAHQAYCDASLPLLRERARMEENIEHLTGFVVRLEPSWLVTPAR